MAVNLTQWEKDQVKAIDNLIQKCKLRNIAFEREQYKLNILLNQNAAVETFVERLYEQVPQRLRHFATDLYSALDFLCYLCYCHFKNNGNPIHDSAARNVSFRRHKNLKRSDVAAQEDSCSSKRREFVWREFTTVLTCLPQDGFGPLDEVTQQKYNPFKEIILGCQIITKIGGDGQPVQPQPDQLDEAKYFNRLHYLRNTTVHCNFVQINVQNGWLYFNRQDGSHEISAVPIPDRDNDPVNWESFPVHPGYWIPVPSPLVLIHQN
ncbi:Hypothetical predicted protein [Paramuricea clavata]|uniref:Uncharacterized protein n=1 Tax=Paramuricea clavata TaxID=317549 RepID=A0A6S7ITK8_PARCT|nr:Hypothetical predicted protein [Paramuricea clavata]